MELIKKYLLPSLFLAASAVVLILSILYKHEVSNPIIDSIKPIQNSTIKLPDSLKSPDYEITSLLLL